MKNLIRILTAISFIAISGCEFEIPTNPFSSLDNATVTASLDYLDGGITQYNMLTFDTVIPEEYTSLITSYKWEIKDIFDNTVKESSSSKFIITEGLKAEKYKAILTIVDESGNKRSFSKEFVVAYREIAEDLEIFGLHSEDDTGISNSDNITKINNNFRMVGKSTGYSNVSIVLSNKATSFLHTIAATIDVEGNVEATATRAENFEDGRYEVTLISTEDPDIASKPVFITIVTKKPVIEWKNPEQEGSANWGDSVTAYGLVKTQDTIAEYSRSGNFASLSEIENFDSYTSGDQTITITATDPAGNESDPITRTISVLEPDTSELVTDGDFSEGDGRNISTNWNIQVQGNLVNISNDQWGGTMTSVGGVLNYGGYWAVDMMFKETVDSNTVLNFIGSSSAAGDFWSSAWVSRTKGHAYQKIAVQKGVTYTASVDTKFGGGQKFYWNSIAVTSEGLGLDFKEGNLEFNAYEDGFGGGTAVRVTRIPSSDESYYSFKQMSVEFTPTADGFVYVGVIKSNITEGSRDGCPSQFDNISVKASDWPKAE